MLKAVLHALACSKCADTPSLVVMILPVWDVTPWNSTVFRGYDRMATLIHIPKEHMRFVPAQRQYDEATADLTPHKWPVEFVFTANATLRGAFLCHDRIQSIIAPAIRATCRLKPEETLFLPTPPSTREDNVMRTFPHPTRLIPIHPVTPTNASYLGPATPNKDCPHTPITSASGEWVVRY